VLPNGFHKIRYYGLWHPSRREQVARARLLLKLDQPTAQDGAASVGKPRDDATASLLASDKVEPVHNCSSCKEGRLVQVGRLYPKQASGP
jgi:hypothetical protein